MDEKITKIWGAHAMHGHCTIKILKKKEMRQKQNKI